MTMKITELRDKAEKDLHKMLADAKLSLHDLSFKSSLKQLTDVKAMRNTRRLIARILTVLKERHK